MRIAKRQFVTTAAGALVIAFAWSGPAAHAQTADHYQNFNSAIYVAIDEMRQMAADPKFMQDSFDVLHAHIKFNKVWLETYRSDQEIGEADVRKVKQFFESKGIRTSGGIMAVLGAPGDGIRSFCWSNPEHRERFRKLVAFNAGIFDELIFDDLFMYNCRCDLCQRARGNRSWTEFRLAIMKEVGENLVVKNARSVNPKINLIFKPPNWYEQYQFSGYNLEAQPKVFDMIYAGTETRDTVNTVQHLQPYQSYGLMRYFEHIKPGKFGGGWVDPGQRQTLNRFAEQLEDTLFARPKEITIWSWGGLLESIPQSNGPAKVTSILGAVAGDAYEKLDSFLSKLGQPYGVASYKPYHSSGEMYLHNYIGMIGIPMDLYPEFPEDRDTILLTEHAKFDPQIVDKIWKHLNADKTVVITTGLLQALEGKGIERVAEVEYTGRNVIANKFTFRRIMDEEPANYYYSQSDIVLPQLAYGLVDSEEIIQAIYKDASRYPVLLRARGLAKGRFYVLTIPENSSDLYQLPQEVLSQIRRDLMREIPVYLDAPSQICLFTYDNNTFVTRSYQPGPVRYKIVVKKASAKLFDLRSGDRLRGYVDGDATVFEVLQMPRTYAAYRFE
ncbi:MAG: hypothetical protein WBL61_14435 [Bryobacteraceae bacterium]